MTVNLSKTFLTFSARMLLVAASVMSSDARPHANRHEPIYLNRTRFPADNGSDIFGLALEAAARAEDLPDQRPMLRIEPGMHTAQINRIGVDAACTLMVTGSHDKTARLWALPEGGRGEPDLLRTLRVPIGEGDEGKVYAVALSPDGKWVAAGGWDAHYSIDNTMAVYIFEAATGRLVTRLGSFGMSSAILPFRPMAAVSWRRLVVAKACACGRHRAGNSSPRTRTMAARAAMARLSMERTSSTPLPMTARSAAMARMAIWKRRLPRRRQGAL